MNNNTYPFPLTPLPYAYDALEPFIDTKTMQLHHDKHLGTFVNNLNAILKDQLPYQSWTLEQLLFYADQLPPSIRTDVLRNGGGVYNHVFFFANLAPANQVGQPSDALLQAINAKFGSLDNFKTQFKTQALSVFGSGYTWLVLNKDGGVEIINLANQDTVLPLKACPIIGLDVWEHAYYLKNYNVRANYIDNWFNVLNWEQANRNFKKCLSQ